MTEAHNVLFQVRPQSLYLHVPFCRVKCHYCDFAVRVLEPQRAQVQMQRYLAHLQLELQALGTLAGPLKTLYIGGGTPALLGLAEIDTLCRVLGQNFDLSELEEWTLEANPEDLAETQIQAWLDWGMNRVSLGAQSFVDQELEACGRAHDRAQIEWAVRLLRKAGVDNLSLDFIYGLPGQTLETWQSSLTQAMALSPEHLSLYALEVHPETQWGHRNLSLPEDDDVADMYDLAVKILAPNYTHYEIANWSKAGRASQHNQVYWQNKPFLAAGVGAHGYWQRRRYAHSKNLRQYYVACQQKQWPWLDTAPQPLQAEIEETVFLGLRQLQQGLDLKAFAERFAQPLEQFYPETLTRLLAEGWLIQDKDRLCLSEQAVSVSSSVFVQFLEPQMSAAAQ